MNEFLDKVFFNNNKIPHVDLVKKVYENNLSIRESSIVHSSGKISYKGEFLRLVKQYGLVLEAFLLEKQKQKKRFISQGTVNQKYQKIQKLEPQSIVSCYYNCSYVSFKSKFYKNAENYENDNHPLTEQINFIKQMGNFHQQPDSFIQILKIIDQLDDKKLIDIKDKTISLTLIYRQYLSLLSFGKRNIFEFLLNQPKNYKQVCFQILIILLTSKLAVDYFIDEFPEQINKLITIAITQFNWDDNLEKFETTGEPRFATIFQCGLKLPSLSEEFSLAVLAAQIIQQLSKHSEKAKITINKRVAQLFQVLKEFKTVEVVFPVRLDAICSVIRNLTEKSKFDFKEFDPLEIMKNIASKAFCNNKRSLKELSSAYQEKQKKQYEFNIIDKDGKFITNDRYMLLFKQKLFELDQIFTNQLLEDQFSKNQRLQQIFANMNKLLIKLFDAIDNNKLGIDSILSQLQLYSDKDLQNYSQFSQHCDVYQSCLYHTEAQILLIQIVLKIQNEDISFQDLALRYPTFVDQLVTYAVTKTRKIIKQGQLPSANKNILENLIKNSQLTKVVVYGQISKCLTILSSSQNAYIYNWDLLQPEHIKIDPTLIYKNQQLFDKLKQTILTNLFEDDFCKYLMSITSPQLILELSVLYFPRINLPKLLWLRTYQDGPEFINEFLKVATSQVAQIQPELIHFIIEFSSQIVWLGSDSVLFQSEECQRTNEIFELFRQQVGVYYITSSNVSQSKILAKASKLMLSDDVSQITRQKIIETSQIFSNKKEELKKRMGYFALAIPLLHEYEALNKNMNCIMEETGWYQSIIQKILSTMSDFEDLQVNWIVLKTLIMESMYFRSKPYLYQIINNIVTLQNDIKPLYSSEQFDILINHEFTQQERNIIRTEPNYVDEDFQLFDKSLFVGFVQQGTWQVINNLGQQEFFFNYYTKYNTKGFNFKIQCEFEISKIKITKINFISDKLIFIYCTDGITMYQIKIEGTTQEIKKHRPQSKIIDFCITNLQEQLLVQEQNEINLVNLSNQQASNVFISQQDSISGQISVINSQSKYTLVLEINHDTAELLVLCDFIFLFSQTLDTIINAAFIINPEDHSSQLKIILAYSTGVIELRHLLSFQLLEQVATNACQIVQIALIDEEVIYQQANTQQIYNLGKLFSNDLI